MSDDPRDAELAALRARVAALEEVVEELRRRLVHLARLLPLDALPLLEEARAERVEPVPPWSPLDGWVETTELTPSDVEDELTRLWARTGRSRGN